METGDKGKIQRRGRHAEKGCSLDVTKLLAQELTAAVVTCTRVAQSQARHHFLRDERGGCSDPF